MTPAITAVDHFAGVGWGVACHALGIREYGVDAWDLVFAEVAG